MLDNEINNYSFLPTKPDIIRKMFYKLSILTEVSTDKIDFI